MATTSRRRASRYGEHVWQPLVENDFSLGMFRDRLRHAIPPGGAYDLRDLLVHVPGSAFKRGGTNYASVAAGGTALVAIIEYGSSFVVMDNQTTAHLWKVTASTPTDLGSTGFATPWTICKPFSWQGVLVFPEWQGGSGDVPFYYDGTTAAAFDTGAAIGRVGTVHLERIVLANSQANQNRLWFSPTVDAHLDPWDLDNAWIDVEGAITGLASISGQLMVWTDTHMYRITGQSPPPATDMFVEQMADIGNHDARSITVHRGQAYFVNEDGAYVTTGIAPVNLMEDRIQSYWREIMQIGGDNPYTALANEDQLTTGVFGDRFLFVSLLKNSSSEEFYFLCDLTNRAWVRLSNLKGYMFTDDGRYMATSNSARVVGTRGIFEPSAANQFDADGTAVTMQLETRALGAPTGLTAFGDTRVSYDLRAVDNMVMFSDGSSTDATATVAFSQVQDVWVTMRLGLTQTGIDYWTNPGDGQLAGFLDLLYSGGLFLADEVFIGDPLAYDGLWIGDNTGEFGDVPAPVEHWQTVELHFDSTGVAELFVDGAEVWSIADAPEYSDFDTIVIGLHSQNSPTDVCIAYYDYVNVGTTRGGDDLFSDDFSSGDLSNWDSTSGSVSVIAAPF